MNIFLDTRYLEITSYEPASDDGVLFSQILAETGEFGLNHVLSTSSTYRLGFEHLMGVFVTGMVSSVALMALSYNVVIRRRGSSGALSSGGHAMDMQDMQFGQVDGSEPFMQSME